MKQNLLLLHGALGSKNQFDDLKESLSNDFEVHSFDFEGHGARESNKDFTMDLFAQNVIQYLHENKLKKTHIFGYSMGGYVGLKVVIKNPELIVRLVTLGTKFDWTKESAEKEMRMLNPEKIEEKVPAFANMLASTHSKNDWKEVVKKTAQMMYGLGTGNKITEGELKKIKHSVLIGIGNKDRMVTIEESKENADILPNGKLKIIDNFPHPIEKVNKKELQEIILNFINK